MCKKFFLLVTAITLFCFLGCAAFEKEKIPRVDVMPDLSSYKSKPSASVEFSFYRGYPENNPTEIDRAQKQMKNLVATAINKTGLFSNVSFEEDDANAKDYKIDLKIYNHGNVAAASLSGFITGFTFGVIPGTAIDDFTVQLTVLDRQGNQLGKYSNDDSVQTWIGLWFIPWMGHTPKKAVCNTIENQVITALLELFNDNVLNYLSDNKALSGDQRNMGFVIETRNEPLFQLNSGSLGS